MTEPTNGAELPRLIRRVAASQMPGGNFRLSYLDKDQNLLFVNLYFFNQLSEQQKKLVYRTNEPSLMLYNGRVVPERLVAESA